MNIKTLAFATFLLVDDALFATLRRECPGKLDEGG